MKATTTRKNVTKRALAGFLAMTSMMTMASVNASAVTAPTTVSDWGNISVVSGDIFSGMAAAGSSSVWDTTDKVFEYTPKALSFVGSDAEIVGKYGEGIYKIIKSGAKMDIGGLYNSGMSFLKLLGVVKTAAPGVTLEDINKNISELRALTEYISQELHLTQQQAYRNGLQSFDNAVIALYNYCSTVQGMYTDAARDLELQGVAQPGENATGEELFAYNKAMIDYITAQEKTGNWKYKNYTFYMNLIETNFNEAAGEVSKKQDQSPLTCYDNYINSFFNWDTQGWYARQAYRSNIEFALKTAYAHLAVFYNIGSEETKLTDGSDAHEVLTKNMSKALNAMESNGAGTNPNDVGKECPWPHYITAHCFTLNLDSCGFSGCYDGKGGISMDQLKNYVSRLNGRTVIEDLELAGFARGGGRYHGFDPDRNSTGIAFSMGDKKKVRILTWDGQIKEKEKSYVGYVVLW